MSKNTTHKTLSKTLQKTEDWKTPKANSTLKASRAVPHPILARPFAAYRASSDGIGRIRQNTAVDETTHTNNGPHKIAHPRRGHAEKTSKANCT